MIRQLKRGNRVATYGDIAVEQCGEEVVRLSIYVRIHPRGMRCNACDVRAFVVHYKKGRWKVWTGF